ncbi:MAG: rhomboid family intramembrane serine protease [Elusimicrobia bacterium]|nr:rhomboid family intramembrane serine protease [Elusimicrobiota bacterium]
MIPLKDNVPRRSWPVINVLIILVNIAVFWHEISLPGIASVENLIQGWGIVPLKLLASPWMEWPTVFTSMFLHGGWSHIIANMLYLWIFGDNVEDRMGHFLYLVFYLCVGTVAAITQVYFNPLSQVPMIGASGAIAGVLGAYFVLYPNARVLALVPIWFFLRIVEIPAVFFLGFWFIIQALQGLGSISQRSFSGDMGGVAWWAHAGGFAAGLFLVGFFKRRSRRR